ncbi:hypothetical protein [Dictyobacter arantiisoli]|uniref:Photosynthesis system II assembly factor Ycf48/Hcf136-like domain-containing protein n=1 Tax=Dictyobacter arantiisoli TaxID=2014874 RepID=A0A5A5THG5_9CHLR|nr:hypothetical protein [Dictyobacter arantiisoli]GCF10469.1 hypothetical protein KDI_40330 [Dictyobacter arantiisoli]
MSMRMRKVSMKKYWLGVVGLLALVGLSGVTLRSVPAFATSDSGLSWRQIGSTGVIGDLDFTDRTNGVFITATNNMYLFHTRNGGQSWQFVYYTIQ